MENKVEKAEIDLKNAREEALKEIFQSSVDEYTPIDDEIEKLSRDELINKIEPLIEPFIQDYIDGRETYLELSKKSEEVEKVIKDSYDENDGNKNKLDEMFSLPISLDIHVLEKLSGLEEEKELLVEKSTFKNVMDKASLLVDNFFNEVIENMLIDTIKSLKISDVEEIKLFVDGIIKSMNNFNIDNFIEGIEQKTRWEEMAFCSPEEEYPKVSPIKIGEIVVKNGKSFTNEELLLNLLETNYGGKCSFVKIRAHYKIWKDDDFDLLINNLISLGKITFRNGYISLIEKENIG